MLIFYILFLLFITFYEPVYGQWAYKRFMNQYSGSGTFRLRYYRFIQLSLWVPAILLVIYNWQSELSFAEAGFKWPTISDQYFSSSVSLIILATALIYLVAMFYQYFAQRKIKGYREKVAEMSIPKTLEYVLPATPAEKKSWLGVCLAAGIAEEIIYRGFLLLVLTRLFPAVPMWTVVPLASLLFGLGHSYQGPGGILKTTIAGLFLNLVYMASGSLLPGMLLHFVQDYIARDIITIRREEAASKIDFE